MPGRTPRHAATSPSGALYLHWPGWNFLAPRSAGRACKALGILNLKAEGLNNYGRSPPLGFLMCSIGGS
jgi:hypothetical protein